MLRHSAPSDRTISRSRGRALLKDQRGVAAVEFGLIAPVLLVMLIGVIEVTRAVSIDRRFGQVTSMVADLVAREERITADDVEAIYGIVEHVMGVWGTSTLKLEIIPVRAAADDPTRIYVYADEGERPSYGTGAPAPKAACQPYAGLTGNLLNAGNTAIVVQGEYGYTPLIVGGMLSPQTWRDRAVMAPRQGSCVKFQAENPSDLDECEPDPACS